MNSTALTNLMKFVNHISKQVSLRPPKRGLVKVDTRAPFPSAKWIKWHPQQNFSSFIISAFLESPHNPAHPSPQEYGYQPIRQQNIVTFYNITVKYMSSQQDSTLEGTDFEPLTQQTVSPQKERCPRSNAFLKYTFGYRSFIKFNKPSGIDWQHYL